MDSSFDICEPRHRGNAESVEAWGKASKTASVTCLKILEGLRYVKANGGEIQGATAKELANWLQRPLHAISGRCSDLKQAGLVKPSGNVRNGSRELVAV